MNKRSKRKLLVIIVVLGVALATVLGLTAFEENMMYFYSPTEVKNGTAPDNRTIRVGGLVVAGTVERASDSLLVKFDLTDNAEVVSLEYSGILPDLFREGQGIVATGNLNANGVFVADEVLAKHDENYMPPEVADALEAAEQKK
ncbi:MAG: cytochrome c maturation protein CcmE [Gammaproteobacteria bacterium]|nr:cytochrome c maturation protein CcmE [Gammaproteobacteria bacterium]